MEAEVGGGGEERRWKRGKASSGNNHTKHVVSGASVCTHS